MKDMFAFLNAIAPVEATAVEKLWQAGTERFYARGEILTREGQVQRDVLWVEEGIQMACLNHHGDLHVVAFTYPPSFSGVPDSFLLQQPSKYSLEALTDTRVRAFTHPAVQALFHEFRSLERVFSKQTELLLAGMIDRHLERHTLTMEERYRAFARRSPHLLHLVPHKYLANYLDINPTNFSKLYNQVKI